MRIPADPLLHRAEADLLDDEGMPALDKISEAAHDLAPSDHISNDADPPVTSTRAHAPSRRAVDLAGRLISGLGLAADAIVVAVESVRVRTRHGEV